jgi:hypothetical protein
MIDIAPRGHTAAGFRLVGYSTLSLPLPLPAACSRERRDERATQVWLTSAAVIRASSPLTPRSRRRRSDRLPGG